VPSADVGIVVAASSSVRQRIQTLGRLLRRAKHSSGTEKAASLYVLYAKGTVDEVIYEKANWEEFIGADRNEYYVWGPVAHSLPIREASPPRLPPVDEADIDTTQLQPGEAYPGDPQSGTLYTVDTQGTIRDGEGQLLKPHPELKKLIDRQGLSGRFRVTPKRSFVITTERVAGNWQCTYLGRLETPIEAVTAGSAVDTLNNLSPGDPYPLDLIKGKRYSVLQRDRRLIAEKRGKIARFVVPADKLPSKLEAARLSDIQERLRKICSSGRQISKITVTERGDVVYVVANSAFYVGPAPLGPEGFTIET
jgi:hypothetical protein